MKVMVTRNRIENKSEEKKYHYSEPYPKELGKTTRRVFILEDVHLSSRTLLQLYKPNGAL